MSALFCRLERFGAVLLLLAGLFLLGVLLTPSPVPVQALNPPSPAAAPNRPPLSAARKTVGAYAALSVQLLPISLPVIMR